jgi:nitroimidazol reductase NimA-like FMN-containing flavoprotein (pyridoxamine 5'-phosphate oxidase superfamily)
LLKHIESGGEICIAITIVDGIVLARSVFSHSINYRSVVLFGKGVLVEGDAARLQALEAFTDRLIPGRWQDARPPSPVELKQTSIVAVAIESASAKIRTGPPKDNEDDLNLPVWAGVLPLLQIPGAPIADPQLTQEIAVPTYISNFGATTD